MKTPRGFIVMDTGYPGGAENFIKNFKKLGTPADIAYIFLTHAHDDHAGFLADLLDITSAKIILHPAAIAPLAAGQSAQPAGSGYSTRLASLFGVIKKNFTFPSVQLGERAIIFSGNDEEQFFHYIGLPLRIVTLPGHTADSIGLLMEETGDLFCGDAAMNAIISLARHTIFMEDIASFQRSWDKMISLNAKMIYPSHGNPFKPSDLSKYGHFMNGRKLIF